MPSYFTALTESKIGTARQTDDDHSERSSVSVFRMAVVMLKAGRGSETRANELVVNERLRGLGAIQPAKRRKSKKR